MSFTSEIKNEISKLETSKAENISELSAIIKNIGVISGKRIKISTENSSVATRIFSHLKKIYNVNSNITVRKGYNFNKNYLYIIEIFEVKDQLLEDLGLTGTNIDTFIIDDEELIMSYLRGLFMAVGSINDPKKSRYHLEFLVSNEDYGSEIVDLLNRFYLNSKIIKKDNKYMVYIKEAEKIGDFLRLIRAINGLLYFEDIRIYRDHKNMVNRINNCEQANVDKIILSASSQVKDIQILKESGTFDYLDEKLKLIAYYRLKYPESSLKELSSIISLETSVEISKSGLYHRLKKLHDITEKIKKTNN